MLLSKPGLIQFFEKFLRVYFQVGLLFRVVYYRPSGWCTAILNVKFSANLL